MLLKSQVVVTDNQSLKMKTIMRMVLSFIFLFCTVFLFVLSPAGFSSQTLAGGCLSCHSAANLHPTHSSQICTTCHPFQAGAKPVLSATCSVCHPSAAGTGRCPFINVPVNAGTK
jgi:hypothetical protein